MTVSYDRLDLHRVFTQKCLDKFRYLAAYGCELTSTEEDRYVVEITYKNQTTGIKVSFEFRENQIFVYLIRLVNGEIPAYLDAPSRWFYLDNLVKLRSPSTTLPRKEFGDWLTPDDIDGILTAYASALKEYGEDVLRGDFSVFAELAQQIDRPKSSNSIDEVRLIGSNEELSAQKGRLPAQVVSMRPEFTLHDLLYNSVERDPDKVAIVDGDAGYTYEDLRRQSGALCSALQDAGIKKGDRVGVLMEKSWEAIVAMLAASMAGAAYVNINPLLKAPQIQYIVGDCDIRVLIGDSDKLKTLDPGTISGTAFYKGEEPPTAFAGALTDVAQALEGNDEPKETRHVSEVDLATILYTSGSTGLPKGVATSQRNVVVGAQIVSTYLGNTSEDLILSALPLNFDAGMSQFTTSLRVGATLVLQRSRLPGDLLKGLRRHNITGVTGVPPLWSLLLRGARSIEEEPLTHLRYLANTGGRIPQANLDELKRLLRDLSGTDIYLMYGLTEAFRSTYLPPEEVDRGSTCIGKAIPDTEILVINKDGQECAPGEVGELVHRGPTVAMGYWGKEEATNKAYRPNPLAPKELLDVERVVYSGDLVRRDEKGYLYFLGREDAMIKSQGYRLSPEEVEGLLVASGLAREACAFGVPDPTEGQQVMAVVSLRDGAGEEALECIREYVIKNGPPYMVPREILVQDELPKTPSGKIDRKGISNAYSDR